jgi:hypothetical protein
MTIDKLSRFVPLYPQACARLGDKSKKRPKRPNPEQAGKDRAMPTVPIVLADGSRLVTVPVADQDEVDESSLGFEIALRARQAGLALYASGGALDIIVPRGIGLSSECVAQVRDHAAAVWAWLQTEQRRRQRGN